MRKVSHMVEEILVLNRADKDAARSTSSTGQLPLPTDPPIMIPGIADDGSLYPVEKITAHVEGTYHLALSVFIFSGSDLLIQRRAETKYHCGGLWANSCCTHPHMGEDVAAAAERRLTEELGFTIPVTERRVVEYSADVGNGLWEHERVHMFMADVSRDDLEFSPNPDEVSEVRWLSADQLYSEMDSHPEQFTPWFQIYMERFPELEF